MLQRARPQFGLLAALANASTLVIELSHLADAALADDSGSDETSDLLADLHGLAIDVWEYVDRLVDAEMEAAQ